MQKFVKVRCGDKELKLSNLDKVLWPEDGFTKADLIGYYSKVAPFILPHLKGRPLTLRRFPDGIRGKTFYQKQKPDWAPEWIPTFTYRSKTLEKDIEHLICEDLPCLIWLSNLANIEFNPTLSRADRFEHPDYVVFDLDPFEPASFEDAKSIALIIRDGLGSLKLSSWVKTSGATGLQVYLPIERSYTFDQTRKLVERIASMVERLMPDKALSAPLPLEERKGKVFIDPLQNSPTKTVVAPYSLKPLPKAPVSTPLKWEELESEIKPEHFNIRTIPDRLKQEGDLFKEVLTRKQDLDKILEGFRI